MFRSWQRPIDRRSIGELVSNTPVPPRPPIWKWIWGFLLPHGLVAQQQSADVLPRGSSEVEGASPSPTTTREWPSGSKAPDLMNREIVGSNPTSRAKLYVIGRSDIPPGLRASQMLHASRLYAEEHPSVESQWYRASNTIVLLEVPDEDALKKLTAEAELANCTVSSFEDDDLPSHGTTALTLGPEGKRLLRSLPLAFHAL